MANLDLDCELIPYGDKYICPLCKWQTKFVDIHRNCPTKSLNKAIPTIPEIPHIQYSPPTIVNKIENFTVATINHIKNGSPKSSQEQINDRLNVCKECPLFKKYSDEPITGVCTHKSCGCNISDKQKFLNKLSWKDQHCPLNKWEEVDQNYID